MDLRIEQENDPGEIEGKFLRDICEQTEQSTVEGEKQEKEEIRKKTGTIYTQKKGERSRKNK